MNISNAVYFEKVASCPQGSVICPKCGEACHENPPHDYMPSNTCLDCGNKF